MVIIAAMGVAFCAFILIRIVHRLYYVLMGHVHLSPSYSPKKALDGLLSDNRVAVSSHEIKARDGVTLRYRRIGRGKKIFLLANGVGTDFFMWLPAIRGVLRACPVIFDEITLLVPNYRGLFEPNDDKFGTSEVSITVKECVEDIEAIMKHCQLAHIEGLIGWSTGAQVGLEFAAKCPDKVGKLFLFNPSCGETLHTALQPFFPLPRHVGNVISRRMTSFIVYLKTLIPQPLWNKLKKFNDSVIFFSILSAFAFLGGFPPEQPSYFHEYMKDAFKTRSQTRALLDLILSLDEPMSAPCFNLEHSTTILSGVPDFLTGVYHSQRLEKTLRNSTHIPFTMGSHFLLIEFPDDVSKELVKFLVN